MSSHHITAYNGNVRKGRDIRTCDLTLFNLSDSETMRLNSSPPQIVWNFHKYVLKGMGQLQEEDCVCKLPPKIGRECTSHVVMCHSWMQGTHYKVQLNKSL